LTVKFVNLNPGLSGYHSLSPVKSLIGNNIHYPKAFRNNLSQNRLNFCTFWLGIKNYLQPNVIFCRALLAEDNAPFKNPTPILNIPLFRWL
jgi:hypothetical protein